MSLKVEAIKLGFYGLARRRPGTPSAFFEIKNEQEYSYNWMKPIGWKPEKPCPSVFSNAGGRFQRHLTKERQKHQENDLKTQLEQRREDVPLLAKIPPGQWDERIARAIEISAPAGI